MRRRKTKLVLINLRYLKTYEAWGYPKLTHSTLAQNIPGKIVVIRIDSSCYVPDVHSVP